MKFQQIILKLAREDEDFVQSYLYDQGIDTLEIIDDMDWAQRYENHEKWVLIDPVEKIDPTLEIRFYLSEKDHDQLDAILETLKDKKIEFHLGAVVDDQAEVQSWKDFFKIMKIGRFVVVPAWEHYEGEGDVIVLEPGMAFGTGDHETTRACLALLSGLDLCGKNVLDIGTGSGILAIAAHKAGAKEVDGTDIDPLAVKQAVLNAEKNHFKNFEVYLGDFATHLSGPYDIVLMNLLSGIIIKNLHRLKPLLSERAHVILSGILVEERSKIESALKRNGFMICETVIDGQWISFLVESEK